jgi:hypothetical protein
MIGYGEGRVTQRGQLRICLGAAWPAGAAGW